MDSGLYAVCTALVARTDALDKIANNLANASTGGYRSQHVSFSAVLAGSGQTLNSELNEVVNHYGVLGQSHLNLTEGSLEHTGNPLDVAIGGPGFLSVQTANGPVYTRNGSLKLSPQGQLITAGGDAVIGEGGVISLPRGASVTISPDGTISANGAIAGRLKLVEFAPGTELQSKGSNYYTAPAKSEIAATHSQVQQGMLEGSNVNPIGSVVELIDAQRSADTMRHALTMIDSELDKTAVQELPRVS